MIHFKQYETDFIALALAVIQPDSIELAKQSTLPWLLIEFTIENHGDTMICYSRKGFLQLMERVGDSDKRMEAVPHLLNWMHEKGMPFASLVDWKMDISLTSKLPAGISQQ